jgi:hypothetical protein
MMLRLRRLIAPLARLACPGYGCCGRCRLPWAMVKCHVTRFSSARFDCCLEAGVVIDACGSQEQARKLVSGQPVSFSDLSISANRGCFALCESCWKALRTPAARLPFYAQLVIGTWNDVSDWPQIQRAVMEGK